MTENERGKVHLALALFKIALNENPNLFGEANDKAKIATDEALEIIRKVNNSTTDEEDGFRTMMYGKI